MQIFADMEWVGLAWATAALALGGLLKGATGAGSPVVAVPVIALYFDVPTAVAVMVLPNFMTNALQSWTYRKHLPGGAFPWAYAAGGFAGALAGTVMLAHVPPEKLLLMVAAVVFLYIGFRLLRPDWSLDRALANRLVLPVGTVAGILQGATGVSAPVSITFLNAMKPERPVFIATISVFFLAMTLVQIPALAWYGLLSPKLTLASAVALAPLMAAMPVGTALAKRVSPKVFDRVILTLLGVIAAKLVLDALT